MYVSKKVVREFIKENESVIKVLENEIKNNVNLKGRNEKQIEHFKGKIVAYKVILNF